MPRKPRKGSLSPDSNAVLNSLAMITDKDVLRKLREAIYPTELTDEIRDMKVGYYLGGHNLQSHCYYKQPPIQIERTHRLCRKDATRPRLIIVRFTDGKSAGRCVPRQN